ncbi:MAG: hypothetical protein WAM42_24585 [Candidatus Nitrosopolaris sp.]
MQSTTTSRRHGARVYSAHWPGRNRECVPLGAGRAAARHCQRRATGSVITRERIMA